LKRICKYFRGDRPCKYYWIDKKHNCFDPNSPYYKEYSSRILLIKLDALGDVIRCTPLARGIKNKYPNAELIWLTQKESIYFLSNNNFIDKVIPYSEENIRILLNQSFDTVINLDKDSKATSIINSINSKEKLGYGMSEKGYPVPINKEANYHYNMCLDNWGLKNQNTKTYIEMMFDICKLQYDNEKPEVILNTNNYEKFKYNFYKKNNISSNDKLVILNTGCGPVYPHKKWTFEGYYNLIKKLLNNNNIKILLTGGKDEKEINKNLQKNIKTSNIIDTTDKLSLEEFSYLINLSNIVVTGDTMALHLAIALNIKLVTFFGPTPHQETNLFGLGKKLVREELDCLSCHDQFECPHDGKCMSLITSSEVYKLIKNIF
jgi:ADP-heptose:LPS heptosyltransferase